VSLRTAYNHFPSREDLLGAIDAAIAERLGRADFQAADPIEAIAPLYEFFERNTDVLRAIRGRRAAQDLRKHRGAQRKKRVDAWASGQLPDASRAERRQLAALASLFLSSSTWLDLHDASGLSAADAAALARDVITAELRRRKRRSRR
jgi:AcrR family transcriptional regulator